MRGLFHAGKVRKQALLTSSRNALFPLMDEPQKVVGYGVNCLNFVYVAIILCLDAAWLLEPTMFFVDWRIPRTSLAAVELISVLVTTLAGSRQVVG